MHVCVFVFDLLYVDGASLVHLPLRQRRARLAAALPNLEPGHVQFATSLEFQPAAVSAAAAAAAAAAATVDPVTAVDAQASGVPDVSNSRLSPEAIADSLRAKDGPGLGTLGGPSHAGSPVDGGGDIDATADAATAAAAATSVAASDAPTVHEEGGSLKMASADEGAAGTEAAVSDLALQSIEDRIQEFLLESFAGGTEGLMLKALDVAAGYQPSKRSDSWIKLKRCDATSCLQTDFMCVLHMHCSRLMNCYAAHCSSQEAQETAIQPTWTDYVHANVCNMHLLPFITACSSAAFL